MLTIDRIKPGIVLTALALTVLVGLAAVLSSPQSASAYPEPALVPRAWELTFTHDMPRPIAVQDADGAYHWFWYMTYKVVNQTEAERIFVPTITITDDEGRIIDANKDVPAKVFDAIKEKVANPLLEPQEQIIGKVLRGEDYARDSVAIWPATVSEQDTLLVSILVEGLSGEAAIVKIPDSDETTVLRKTLMIDYEMPGRPPTPQSQPVVAKGEHWVMR
ncbi:MAG: hypothetical protein GC164_09180 [Phycisphaera sp.]|nr:hypothetical protein [Phycisphaera sp.]